MSPTENKLAASELESDAIFDHIKQHIKAHPDKAKAFTAVILLKITRNGQIVKSWTLNLKAADLYVGEPKTGSPDTVVTISDEDFVSVILAKLNPQQAFMEGKINVTGNNIWMHKVWTLLRTTATAKL